MSLEPSHHKDSNAKARPEGHDEEREERQACAAESNFFTAWSRQSYHPQRASDHLNDVFNESSAATDQDVSFPLEANVKLERRWMLWYDFMKEHSCMEDWLRAAETTASAPNSSHVLYVTAKEELQKYENLRLETRTRLIKLDSLTQRSRTLVGLFRGTMGARVVEMTKDCGQRWDQLSITVNTVCRRLQHFVRQWEDFERQREEMIMWLTDMDLRLTEVEHFSSKDTCSKMHQLQGFQEAVGESAGLLNDLLQQGEELIQRSEPADAQAIEHQLQEVLLHCARVFQGLGRLHTRLLSMRLVFEEDWALCTPDSGCPSESMLEEECSPSEACPLQSSADQLVLEWDPSVDIGGSISHDDTDDSAFSTTAGGNEPPRFPQRRRFKNDTMKSLDRVAPPWTPLPVTRNHQYGRRFKTSTPETATFDPERISAWLGQTSELRSKAVQTESTSRQEEGVEHQEDVLPQWRPNSLSPSVSHPSRSRDLHHHVHRRHQDPQRQQERLCFPESLEDGHSTKSRREECHPDDSGVGSWGGASPSDAIGLLETRKVVSALLVCLSVLMLAVFIWMLVSPSDAPCHQSNTLARSFSLALRYNAPPPT